MDMPNPVQNVSPVDCVELDLQFDWQMPPLSSRKAGEGDYVGSGDGTATGAKVSGSVRWDLFEKREAALCRSNLIGVIETDDGVQIQFDSRGFFIQPDPASAQKWVTCAAVHFRTTDGRYAWLNSRLALWEGTFDMKTFHHHYHLRFQGVD